MTYPQGWPVVPRLLVRRERWPGGYGMRGTALVYPGQEVEPHQPVMRLERIDLRARSGSPASSPIIVPAGLRGRVIEITRRGGVIIESRAALIQGSIGVGNQVAGVLTIWQAPLPNRPPQQIPPGAILVVPVPLTFAMLRQMLTSGIVGVVASSIAARDLEGFLGADLITLMSSVNHDLIRLPPLTLLFTEGLGELPMPEYTLNLLKRYVGNVALLSGFTSVMPRRLPELLISLPHEETQGNWQPLTPDPELRLGSLVRISAGEHRGQVGRIEYFFMHQQAFLSNVTARAARVRLEDGSGLVVPLANLERIAE
ncbi:MAG TPA: hypothetical protein VFA41_24115 [Ktedonobacteraceae bacterium]|nr:hypothetical protein [Ktedonobacteraceae bacterium]